MWSIKMCTQTNRLDQKKITEEASDINEMLKEGFEPFAVVPYIFKGCTISEILYFKKWVEPEK